MSLSIECKKMIVFSGKTEIPCSIYRKYSRKNLINVKQKIGFSLPGYRK